MLHRGGSSGGDLSHHPSTACAGKALVRDAGQLKSRTMPSLIGEVKQTVVNAPTEIIDLY